MTKKNMKLAAFAALTGTLLQFGGCLGAYFQALIPGLAGTLLAEFVLDNDGVFDLFEDGAEAAAAE